MNFLKIKSIILIFVVCFLVLFDFVKAETRFSFEVDFKNILNSSPSIFKIDNDGIYPSTLHYSLINSLDIKSNDKIKREFADESLFYFSLSNLHRHLRSATSKEKYLDNSQVSEQLKKFRIRTHLFLERRGEIIADASILQYLYELSGYYSYLVYLNSVVDLVSSDVSKGKNPLDKVPLEKKFYAYRTLSYGFSNSPQKYFNYRDNIERFVENEIKSIPDDLNYQCGFIWGFSPLVESSSEEFRQNLRNYYERVFDYFIAGLGTEKILETKTVILCLLSFQEQEKNFDLPFKYVLLNAYEKYIKNVMAENLSSSKNLKLHGVFSSRLIKEGFELDEASYEDNGSLLMQLEDNVLIELLFYRYLYK